MKHLKISFLAIIAVVAMSFTISENIDEPKSAAPLAVTDCFKPDITVRQLCSSASTVLTTNTTCTDANLKVGWHVFALSGVSIAASQIAVQCPGNTTFCCLTLEEDTAPCNAQGQQQFDIGAGPKYYKVSTIYCKTP